MGYDFNLLEVFTVIFFKTASLIVFFFIIFYFCLPRDLHIPCLFVVVVNFWF